MEENTERFPLDETTLTLLADLDKARNDLQQQAERQLAALNGQRLGALMLYVRQHKLPGNWRLDETGRDLVKQPEQEQPAPV